MITMNEDIKLISIVKGIKNLTPIEALSAQKKHKGVKK